MLAGLLAARSSTPAAAHRPPVTGQRRVQRTAEPVTVRLRDGTARGQQLGVAYSLASVELQGPQCLKGAQCLEGNAYNMEELGGLHWVMYYGWLASGCVPPKVPPGLSVC